MLQLERRAYSEEMLLGRALSKARRANILTLVHMPSGTCIEYYYAFERSCDGVEQRCSTELALPGAIYENRTSPKSLLQKQSARSGNFKHGASPRLLEVGQVDLRDCRHWFDVRSAHTRPGEGLG